MKRLAETMVLADRRLAALRTEIDVNLPSPGHSAPPTAAADDRPIVQHRGTALRTVATSELVVPRSMPIASRCWCGAVRQAGFGDLQEGHAEISGCSGAALNCGAAIHPLLAPFDCIGNIASWSSFSRKRSLARFRRRWNRPAAHPADLPVVPHSSSSLSFQASRQLLPVRPGPVQTAGRRRLVRAIPSAPSGNPPALPYWFLRRVSMPFSCSR